MAIPACGVGQPRLTLEIRKGTLGRTLVTLTHKHLVLSVLAHGQNTGLPRKGMAAMKTRRIRGLGRTMCLLQNFLHDLWRKTLCDTRALLLRKDFRLCLGGHRLNLILLRRDTQKENNRSLRSLGHIVCFWGDC